MRKFFAAVFTGRAIRYGLLTLIAAHYGRSIMRYMRHPGRYLGLSLLATFVIVLVTFALVKLSRTSPALPEPGVPQSTAGR